MCLQTNVRCVYGDGLRGVFVEGRSGGGEVVSCRVVSCGGNENFVGRMMGISGVMERDVCFY